MYLVCSNSIKKAHFKAHRKKKEFVFVNCIFDAYAKQKEILTYTVEILVVKEEIKNNYD
jgi:hypothetical protein